MVTRLDARDTARGAETNDRAGSSYVDMSMPENSRMFSRQNTDKLPDAFPQKLELFDSAEFARMYVETMVRLYVQIAMMQLYLQNMYKPEGGGGGGKQPDKHDGGGGKHPDKPDGGGKQPDKHDGGGGEHPDKPDGGGKQPDKPDGGGGKHPDKPDGGVKQPEKPDGGGGKQPEKPDGGGKQPEKPDTPDTPNSHPGKLSNIPHERGRTIYHDDFSGSRGERPNSKIFDTAHIGPNGQTRQRGAGIHEDGIVNVNNTVMDGKGNLQMFATRDEQIDPVNGETVHYSKGSLNTGHGLRLNLKDHPNGVVIEVRAKHSGDPGAKFDPLWIMTQDWAADPKKGQKRHDTIEYDAAEAHGADITIHYPYKDANGNTKDEYGGGAHPKDVDFEDGKYHTYTVVIKPNPKTGRGDVVEYVDGKKEFQKDSVFPGDKDLHLRASLEVSPKWTHEKLTIKGGMDSKAAGYIDYLDVSELK